MTEIKAWDSVRRFWRILLNKLFYAGNKLDRHRREGSMYIALKYQSKYLLEKKGFTRHIMSLVSYQNDYRVMLEVLVVMMIKEAMIFKKEMNKKMMIKWKMRTCSGMRIFLWRLT